MRLLALAACVAAFALVAAGCGGDDDDDSASSAAAWAEDFCTTVQGWTDELETIADEVGDASSLSSETLEQAGNDADAATEDFIEELRDLGAPETDSGEAIEAEVEEFSDTVDQEREEIRDAVEDADGLAGLAQVVGVVSSSIASMGSAVQATIEAIDTADVNGEVRQALEDEPACDDLQNSS
jgi:hypothetical protein